ncbi:hypothetical protein [Prochlorococcus marinus]|uniref:hypothetical protein n=1 Tax=Prochlorococcus marinus TaxID=1219 RepID=UPI0039AF3835
MPKKSPVGIFLAATAALATTAIIPDHSMAGEKHGEMGGTKEWTTDQEADEDGKLDEAAEKAAKKAKKANVCIPIGEGENCW